MNLTTTSTQEILADDNSINYSANSTPSRPSPRCPTLTSFLNQLNLFQYHGLFVDAGVGENDIEQLLGFDEAELKEVMSAISMKPFHSAAFKKGVRELRETFPMLSSVHSYQPMSLAYSIPVSPVELQTGSISPVNTSSASKDVIIHHATIYGKNSSRQLTSYEQAINNAAIELALQDPTLVVNKGALFNKAKAKLLIRGYSYKRGASRSKLNPKTHSRASRATLSAKRNALAAQKSENRNARIAELERKLKVKETQYELAIEVVRTKSSQNDSEYIEKAQVSLEELEKERIEISRELVTLRSKERKHQWYEQKKKRG